MSYTLTQLIGQASNEMGLVAPVVVTGSRINQTLQLLALAQRLGRDLVREFEWQALVRTYVFQTSEGIELSATVTEGSTLIQDLSSITGLCTGGKD